MRAAVRKPQQHIREVLGVFDNVEVLENAIEELQSHGINRSDLSVLADVSTVEKKLGHIYKKVREVEDSADAPRVAYVTPKEVRIAEGALIGTPLYIAATAATGLVVASGGT